MQPAQMGAATGGQQAAAVAGVQAAAAAGGQVGNYEQQIAATLFDNFAANFDLSAFQPMFANQSTFSYQQVRPATSAVQQPTVQQVQVRSRLHFGMLIFVPTDS